MKFITCSGVPELSLCGRLWFARVGNAINLWDYLGRSVGQVG